MPIARKNRQAYSGTRFFSHRLGEEVSISHRQNMIAPDNETVSPIHLIQQCTLLRIARSTWHYEKKGESVANLAVLQEIDRAFIEWPFLGVRPLYLGCVIISFHLTIVQVISVFAAS